MKMINKKLYHYNILKSFNTNIYETLLHDFHVISSTMKELQTTTGNYQGYFCKKDRYMYFIDRVTLGNLPVRVVEQREEVEGKNVVYLVTKNHSFRINPEKTMTFRELVDELAPFDHTNPEDWKLYKILCMASYCSRTFTRISTNPSFGKDSMKGVLGLLTDQVRVLKPRSIPGILKELTSEGEIVLNEVSGIKKEVRDLIQEIILQLGDGSVSYTNGALRSSQHHTKDKYDVHGLSITAMYNRLEDYKSADEFFDYQFANTSAIKDRLFPILLSGILCERFDNDPDCERTMQDNKMVIIQILKNIDYYKKHWRAELKPFGSPPSNTVGRHKQTLEVLFNFINLYAKDQKEYTDLCEMLLKRNEDYEVMVMKKADLEIPTNVLYQGCDDSVVVEDLVRG